MKILYSYQHHLTIISNYLVSQPYHPFMLATNEMVSDLSVDI